MLLKRCDLKIILIILVCLPGLTTAQSKLTLKEAVDTAVRNYGIIRAKTHYHEASRARMLQSKYDNLPNFNIAVQNNYGTINGQNGPLYGFGGLGVGSSGLPLPEQNWNSAFGALYLTNVNWEFFAFGRAREKVKISEVAVLLEESDLEQEIFQHRIKVAGTYLNLLAASRLRKSYQQNLERADAIKKMVSAKAHNGLIAGVDSSLASAEVASAKILLLKSRDFEQEQSNKLAQLMGVAVQEFSLDSLFLGRLPGISNGTAVNALEDHPLLKIYKNRLLSSQTQSHYFKTFFYPSFSLVGIFQTRGSGFSSQYAADQTAYTHSIFEGFRPVRSNYLIGIGATWNLTQPLRYAQQVRSQDLISKGLQEEQNLVNQQLAAQLELADVKMANALALHREVPIQLKAASDAYQQKSVQYKNGMTTLVEVTQAMYALIRAETDRDISNSNVWQALLLRAAAMGDYGVFETTNP